MEFVTLNNGVKMPMEGFGVFQVPEAVLIPALVGEIGPAACLCGDRLLVFHA